MRISSALEAVFGFDLRALGLFRIALGLIVFTDLILRSLYLHTFYSDAGIFSRVTLITDLVPPWQQSIHFMNGTLEVQALLFILHAFAAVCMTLGCKTRLAVFFVWLLTCSLHARNPLVLQGGDVLLRLLLFWGMFMPLGERFSLDQKFGRSGNMPGQKPFLSVATMAYVLQIVVLYSSSGFMKARGEAWHDGTAVFNAMSIDQFATWLAVWVRDYHDISCLLTPAVLRFEQYGLLLLLIPVGSHLFRTAIVLAMISMHIGFALCLKLGPFPWINCASMLPLLPAWFLNLAAIKFAVLRNPVPQTDSDQRKTIFKLFLLYGREAAAAICLMIVLRWNYLWHQEMPSRLPRWVDQTGSLLRLDQKWDMFAPFPLVDDGWYVFHGVLKSGREIDLFPALGDFLEAPSVSYDRPRHIADMYKGERWRKFLMNLWLGHNRDNWSHVARYVCREWNKRHGGSEQLDKFKVHFMLERTLPNFKIAPVRPVTLWRHYCFAGRDEDLPDW